MTTEQQEALRLADLLEQLANEGPNWQVLELSAAELRRLHAEVERLKLVADTDKASADHWRAECEKLRNGGEAVDTAGVFPEWKAGDTAFKQWCWQHFGPDADESYLAEAVLQLPRKQVIPMKAADEFELHRLLAEERYTVRQLTRALREATEAPTFMGEPVTRQRPSQASPTLQADACKVPQLEAVRKWADGWATIPYEDPWKFAAQEILCLLSAAPLQADAKVPQWQPTDDELTAVYKKANGEDVGKAKPLTTASIFKAMRAILSAAPTPVETQGWLPIETAPDGELVVVGWIDPEDKEDRHEFDYKEDGGWVKHLEHHEHVTAIGGWGVSETAPYTHWKHIGPVPTAPSTPPMEPGQKEGS